MYNIRYYYDIITVLTLKEIKIRYKRSIFGYFWSLINPLVQALVFYFAFKFITKVPIEDYALFLITGLFPWQWFANSVGAAPNILISNASIIKKVNFPRYLLPMSNVISEKIHFLLSIPIIVLFNFLYDKNLSVSLVVGIIILSLIQFLVVYGFVLIISSINLFFRDLERITFIFLNILFYLSPIIYDVSLIPDEYIFYLHFNPMFGIIHLWHTLFLHNHLVFSLSVVYFLYALLICCIGIIVFKKLSPRFAEVL